MASRDDSMATAKSSQTERGQRDSRRDGNNFTIETNMSTQNETTVAKPEPKALTIRDRLTGDAFRQAVQAALPKHLTPERFIRIATTALTKTPKLMECDQASFFNALLSLSQLGLEPDGRRAHLIPYGKTCQLVIDYKGLVELAMRSGSISNLHADVIREGDLFKYSAGELTEHVPHFLRRDADKPLKAGNIIAAYAVCTFKDESTKCEILSADEIEGIRQRSKAGNSGPWVTDFAEMAKKTAFRRLSKWLPLSPEYRDALDADDDAIEPVRKHVTIEAPSFLTLPAETETTPAN